MSFWKTNTGRSYLRHVEAAYAQKSRVLLFIGAYPEPLLRICLSQMGIPVSKVFASLDDMSAWLPPADASCCIILQKLASTWQDDPVQALKRYCQRHSLQLLTAPCELTQLDFAQELDEALRVIENPDRDPALDWVIRVAHESAVILSGGAYSSFFLLRKRIIEEYIRQPDALPDVTQLVAEITQANQQLMPYARSYVQGDPPAGDTDDILVLWSLGLAGKTNGRWQYSFQLLSRPNFIRTLTFRYQLTCMQTLTPVYQAWVHYCCQKYAMQEMTNEHLPRLWYADKNFHDAISSRHGFHTMQPDGLSDSKMTVRVWNMRNWVQHSDNYENAYQNTAEVLKTCVMVMRRINMNGQALNTSSVYSF